MLCVASKVPMFSKVSKHQPVVLPKQTFHNGMLSLATTLTLLTSPVDVAKAQDYLVMMGDERGQLVFVPDHLTINTGDTVTFRNYAAYPHKVEFDDEDVPEGVDTEQLDHDSSNGPGDEVSNTFTIPGHYGYFCAPHRSAGMVGSIDVVSPDTIVATNEESV